MENSVRAGYEKLGIEGYYKLHNKDYSNPHINEIRYLVKESNCIKYIGKDILDLCCGSGEITNILESIEPHSFNIEGLDPYTTPEYKKKTSKMYH